MKRVTRDRMTRRAAPSHLSSRVNSSQAHVVQLGFSDRQPETDPQISFAARVFPRSPDLWSVMLNDNARRWILPDLNPPQNRIGCLYSCELCSSHSTCRRLIESRLYGRCVIHRFVTVFTSSAILWLERTRVHTLINHRTIHSDDRLVIV